MFFLDTEDFSITDGDNVLIYQATLTITNAVEGVDRLMATDDVGFTVRSNDQYTQLVITARNFFTQHFQLIEFLKTVSFNSTEQFDYSDRIVSLVVQEFPAVDTINPPSEPFLITVRIIGVNNRPVLLSTQIAEETLDNYIPNNPGFFPSHLINESDVFDIDRMSNMSQDIIGLAIVYADSEPLGSWERWTDDQGWAEFPSTIDECSPEFVRDDERIRFMPAPNVIRISGTASIDYHAWDGSSLTTCVDGVFDDQAGGTYIT